MRKLILILVLFFSGLSIISAQEKTKDSLTYKLPYDIIVTAPRLDIPMKSMPFSTSIVTKDMLDINIKNLAADEPLRLVPGVKVDNQSNSERVHLSIRGIGILSERGVRGIRIIQDGIPINDASGFAPDLYDIDWNNVSSIEVLRGPAAALYGGSATGGIINIITSAPKLNRLSGEASFVFGSNNFWKGWGKMGGATENVSYNLSFSREMGDGYREHTHFWGNKIYGLANITPTPNIKITPVFNYINSYAENPEGIDWPTYSIGAKTPNSDAIPYNEYLGTERFTGGVTSSMKFGDHDVNISAFTKTTIFTEANNNTFVNRNYNSPGFSAQYTFNSGEKKDYFKNHVSVGTDGQFQTIDETRVFNYHSVAGTNKLSDVKFTQAGVGFFILDKFELGQKWSFMLSGRFDQMNNKIADNLKKHYLTDKDPDGNPFITDTLNYDASGELNFNQFTGRLGITYSPAQEFTIYSNVGQGFLPPATEELAQNPDNFGGFNTHIIPSTSIGGDLGFRGSIKEKFYFDVTGFYFTTKNDIDRYRLTDPLRNQETFYRNAGATNRVGLELYAKYYPLNNLCVQAAYTYSSFKYSNNDTIRIMMDDPTIFKYIQNGNYLPNSPQHQLNVDIQYDPIPCLSLGISTETLSNWYIDGANFESEAAPGYTLLHARIVYKWNINKLNGELSFNVRNAGDLQYIGFTEPDPGGNAYQPAARREFFGTIKVRL